jgi:transposase
MTNNLSSTKYYQDHKDLGLVGCASNMGISQQTLSRWKKELEESGDIECRGSGNYSSDEEKEIARLKRELRDTKDALDVLKKAIGILGN